MQLSFWKNPTLIYSFMIKVAKGHLRKTNSQQNIVKGWMFSSWVWEQVKDVYSFLLDVVLEVPAIAIRQAKEIRQSAWKERSWTVFIHRWPKVENSEDHKKLLEQIDSYRKFITYRISIHKPVVFLYMNREHLTL